MDTRPIVLHPFYVECLLYVLDQSTPGPGASARLRLSELWGKVHECLWPGLPLTETGSRWLNPTSTPAQIDAARKNAAKDEGEFALPPTFDKAAAVTLALTKSEILEAQKHLDAHLDQVPLVRCRMLQPLGDALAKAAG